MLLYCIIKEAYVHHPALQSRYIACAYLVSEEQTPKFLPKFLKFRGSGIDYKDLFPGCSITIASSNLGLSSLILLRCDFFLTRNTSRDTMWGRSPLLIFMYIILLY
jgi:hypothetical protein